jgi:hypothetical protein
MIMSGRDARGPTRLMPMLVVLFLALFFGRFGGRVEIGLVGL